MLHHPVTEEVHLLEHTLFISFLKAAEHPLLIIAGKSLVIDTILGKMVNVCRAIRDQKEDQSNSAVKKAMLYIQENYSRDISLDDVSSQVNISPYYFSKIFKEETGENFIEYLTRVRIDKAKELLVDANVSVKEAGIQSGYSDPNYFSRIFKKQMDMTPSEYKARYGK